MILSIWFVLQFLFYENCANELSKNSLCLGSGEVSASLFWEIGHWQGLQLGSHFPLRFSWDTLSRHSFTWGWLEREIWEDSLVSVSREWLYIFEFFSLCEDCCYYLTAKSSSCHMREYKVLGTLPQNFLPYWPLRESQKHSFEVCLVTGTCKKNPTCTSVGK